MEGDWTHLQGGHSRFPKEGDSGEWTEGLPPVVCEESSAGRAAGERRPGRGPRWPVFVLVEASKG